jgi:hypothetical protein
MRVLIGSASGVIAGVSRATLTSADASAQRATGLSSAAIRSARCSAADAQRRSIARAAGVAVNRSGVARISSRFAVAGARVADFVRDVGREFRRSARDEAAGDQQPRPRTPTSAISGVSTSIS